MSLAKRLNALWIKCCRRKPVSQSPIDSNPGMCSKITSANYPPTGLWSKGPRWGFHFWGIQIE